MLELALQPFHRSRGLALAALSLLTPLGRAQQVECISIGLGGQPANGGTRPQCMGSSDGRFVVFRSGASNLVASGPSLFNAAYLRDRVTQVTTLESYLPNGSPTSATRVGVSDDGRYVWFSVDVAPPNGGGYVGIRVYRRDRLTQSTTQLLSSSPDFTGFSNCSADGSLVGFATSVPGPYGSFSYDLGYGGVGPGGLQSVLSGASVPPMGESVALGQISANGRYLTYSHDWTDPTFQLFGELVRHDRQTGQLLLLTNQRGTVPTSITSNGRYVAALQQFSYKVEIYDTLLGTSTVVLQAPYGTGDYFRDPALSEDGRFVAFRTTLALDASDTDSAIDVYLLDRSNNQISLLSAGPGGALTPFIDGGIPQILRNTQEVIFTAPDGMVPGDTNGVADLFAVSICSTSYRDADGDGFGDLAQPSQACPVPAGYSVIAGDCDDTSPTRYPGAPELCNGLDDDCDGQVDEGLPSGTTYCVPTPDPIGCVPHLFATGCPSLSASSGYVLRLDQVRGQRAGLFMYGAAPTNVVFALGNPSQLCVAPPRQRMSALGSGGTAGTCDGAFSEDFFTWAAAHPGALLTPFTPGQNLYFQAWVREPAYPGAVLLSAGWQATLMP
ncbi:MAG: MopE-related protein [Planctomycetota bacterium]|nr:MopE-related protein [Planctomycetota bacterium]